MLLLVGSPKRLMKSEKALSFPLRILFFKTQRLGIKKAGSCTGAHSLAMAGVGVWWELCLWGSLTPLNLKALTQATGSFMRKD